MSIPNGLPLVTEARKLYAGLAGPRRAHAIVNYVCWTWPSRYGAADRPGLFLKTGGTRYNDRSLDVIIFSTGAETYDILADAETKATPRWARTTPTGYGDLKKWRAATDPAVLEPGIPVPNPDPTPEPEPEPPPASRLYLSPEARFALDAKLDDVEAAVRALRDLLDALPVVSEP